jgi:hypothetical protein
MDAKRFNDVLEMQAALGCCNPGVAYLAAGGIIPDAVWEEIERHNPLMQLLMRCKPGTKKGGKGK